MMTEKWLENLKPLNCDGLKSVALKDSPAIVEAERAMDLQKGLDAPRKHTSPALRRKMRDLRQNAAALAHVGSLPGPGEAHHCVATGEYSLWSLVPVIAQLAAPGRIESLSIATLSFSKSNMAELFAMYDAGQIGEMSMIVSHYFSATSKAEHTDAAVGFSARNQRFASIRSHAKIICARLTDGTCLTVESSANLRSCKSIEQFTIINDPAVYEFHTGWMREVCEQ